MAYLEAVLPVIKKDVDRLAILDKSIEKFFLDLKTIYTVVPDKEVKFFRNVLDRDRYLIISENEIVPEFSVASNLSGWFKQQLVKLAIAEHISGDFYLTLDADVIVVKPVRYSDLIINGKGIVKRSTRDYHAVWYEWATRVLGLARSGYTHGVTPSIFNKDCVLKLQQYLNNNRTNLGVRLLCRSKKSVLKFFKVDLTAISKKYCGWRNFLIRNIPWTEYSLYHTFLEGKNLFDVYHFDGGESCLYFYNSVWERHQFKDWNPDECFNSKERAWFAVVQSNTGVTAEETWSKVRKFLLDS